MHITAAQVAILNRHAEAKFLKRVADFVIEQHDVEPQDPNLLPGCEGLTFSEPGPTVFGPSSKSLLLSPADLSTAWISTRNPQLAVPRDTARS